jgi:hypothetical protein
MTRRHRKSLKDDPIRSAIYFNLTCHVHRVHPTVLFHLGVKGQLYLQRDCWLKAYVDVVGDMLQFAKLITEYDEHRDTQVQWFDLNLPDTTRIVIRELNQYLKEV